MESLVQRRQYLGLKFVMDCHGLTWTVMDCHGLSWTITEWI